MSVVVIAEVMAARSRGTPSCVTTYRVNEAAVRKARSMIDSHQYVLDSSWSDAQPSTDEENAELERGGTDGYGEWHLGLDQEATEGTKDRYGFPFGDFRRVHRSGLIAAKQRAARNGHDAIESAADELLVRLDEVSGRADAP
jgi:hypothetical protein